MSIRNKLIAAFAILTLLLFSVAILTQLYLTHTRAAQQETFEDTDLRYSIKELQYLLMGISNDERGYILLGSEEYAQGIVSKGKEVLKTLAAIQANPSLGEEDKVIVNRIEQLYASYYEIAVNVSELVSAGNITKAQMTHFNEERQTRKKLDLDASQLLDSLLTEISLDQEARRTDERNIQGLMYGLFAFGALVSVIVAFYIIRSIMKPLRAIDRQMKDIAAGHGDLSQNLVVRSRDEFGDLADTFNRMIRNLRDILSQAQDTAIQVAASSEQLTASAEQTTRATEQIVQATSLIASSSMNEQGNVAEAVSAVQRMSDDIYEVSTSNDEVSRLAKAASDASTEGAQSVREVLADMQALDVTVQQAAVVIQSLGNRSQEIQGIADTITAIAYRTNLLSLNAGIEASRAGEHGKGFGVVALEIRKLAEESRKSAEQIGALIHYIVTDTAHAVSAMHNGTEKVALSLTKTGTVDRALHAIDEHVAAVTERVEQTASTTHQLAASSKQIVALMEQIAEAGNEVAAACQGNSATTEEQLATMEEISSSAQSLSKLADDLNSVLSRFKLQ